MSSAQAAISPATSPTLMETIHLPVATSWTARPYRAALSQLRSRTPSRTSQSPTKPGHPTGDDSVALGSTGVGRPVPVEWTSARRRRLGVVEQASTDSATCGAVSTGWVGASSRAGSGAATARSVGCRLWWGCVVEARLRGRRSRRGRRGRGLLGRGRRDLVVDGADHGGVGASVWPTAASTGTRVVSGVERSFRTGTPGRCPTASYPTSDRPTGSRESCFGPTAPGCCLPSRVPRTGRRTRTRPQRPRPSRPRPPSGRAGARGCAADRTCGHVDRGCNYLTC